MIKGVIFDYGGTIDSRGVHWSEVIWDGYCDSEVPVSKEEFRQSYVMAERELAKVRHILPHHNFYDLLLIKMRIELGDLVSRQVLAADYPVEPKAEAIARYCYDAARSSIEEARPTLEALYARYPMVLVIGDSYKKDIVPAESLGCKVLWIKGKGWTAEEDAQTHPCIIARLSEVLESDVLK